MIVKASAAVSIDGFLDDLTSTRLVLSSCEDWAEVRAARAECDAVLVGAETVRRDNPALVTRDEELRTMRVARGLAPDPIKVTVSLSGNLDPHSRFFTEGDGEKVVILPCSVSQSSVAALEACATVHCTEMALGEQTISAMSILAILTQMGVRSLFVEGGSKILTLFLAEDRVDYLRLAVAPFFVGESDAPRLVGAARFPFNKDRRMRLIDLHRCGDMAVAEYALRCDEQDVVYMTLALEQARLCPTSLSAYSVGAVIVTASGALFSGYSRESAPTNHAEEEAIAKAVSAGVSLEGATLYCTMEPCSIRKSKLDSCTSLVVKHRFSRVVFALYEPSHFVCCKGSAILQQAGISVVVAEEFAQQALQINAHILNP